MKFLSLVFLAGFLLACGHPQTPHKLGRKVTNLDCQNVYQYIMTLTVNQMDEEHKFTKREREGAEWELEQTWIESGSKDRFFTSCESHMTMSQVDCMLHVDRIEDMHTCAILVR